jgi:hypothetical protein
MNEYNGPNRRSRPKLAVAARDLACHGPERAVARLPPVPWPLFPFSAPAPFLVRLTCPRYTALHSPARSLFALDPIGRFCAGEPSVRGSEVIRAVGFRVGGGDLCGRVRWRLLLLNYLFVINNLRRKLFSLTNVLIFISMTDKGVLVSSFCSAVVVPDGLQKYSSRARRCKKRVASRIMSHEYHTRNSGIQ